MAEINYYDGDLSDALEKLDKIMEKLAKAPPVIKAEVLKCPSVLVIERNHFNFQCRSCAKPIEN